MQLDISEMLSLSFGKLEQKFSTLLLIETYFNVGVAGVDDRNTLKLIFIKWCGTEYNIFRFTFYEQPQGVEWIFTAAVMETRFHFYCPRK